MTDLSALIASLESELRLPERKRERKVKSIRRDLCRAKAEAIAEHLQNERDMECTLRPHTTAKLRAA